jgi:hypothetical protein
MRTSFILTMLSSLAHHCSPNAPPIPSAPIPAPARTPAPAAPALPAATPPLAPHKSRTRTGSRSHRPRWSHGPHLRGGSGLGGGSGGPQHPQTTTKPESTTIFAQASAMSVPAPTLSGMASEFPLTLRNLARDQHGILSRTQALRAGLTEDMIKFRIRSDRWRQLHPGIYATFTGAPGYTAGPPA